MKAFDEYEFRSYLRKEVGYSVFKHREESDTQEYLEKIVEQRIDNLPTWDLVAHLGNYICNELGNVL